MKVALVGLSHKTAGVVLREQAAVGQSALGDALRALNSREGIRGCVILSTCNRTEIYVAADDDCDSFAQVAAFLSDDRGIDMHGSAEHFYFFEGRDAIEHLFSVVCSLDSLVMGEQQILGQVRNAYAAAAHAGTAPLLIAHLFRSALSVGRRVRNETGISERHVSVSTVAIDVARDTFGALKGLTATVLGTGEASDLAARYLSDQGVDSFIVLSRTFEHAQSMASELGGRALPIEDLACALAESDILVCATSAPHAIVAPEHLSQVKKRLLILDIAMPRDVAPRVAEHPCVELYDLDGLSRIADGNKAERERDAVQARAIVDEEVESFLRWKQGHSATPAIKQLRAMGDSVVDGELAHLMKALGDVSPEVREACSAALRAVSNKLLHEPTVRMRQCAMDGTGYECVEAARFLFGLDDQVGHAFPRRRETL